MPLSPPAKRELRHTRSIICEGYARDDGNWDIEAEIKDVKAYAFENEWRGTVTPDQALHRMKVRLTIDDSFLILGAEAVIEDSPFQNCASIAPNLAGIVGLRIKGGWMQQVKQVFGGTLGCTHIFELLRTMATVAFQTARGKSSVQAKLPPGQRPFLLNSCHMFDENRPEVRARWPEYFETLDKEQKPLS